MSSTYATPTQLKVPGRGRSRQSHVLLGVGAVTTLAGFVPSAAFAAWSHRSGMLGRSSYVGGAVATALVAGMIAFHFASTFVARGMVGDTNVLGVDAAELLLP